MKHQILSVKIIAIAATLFVLLLLPVSCGGNSENDGIVPSNFEMDWTGVNQSMEAADLSPYGYYREKDYQTTEKELNYVSLYNYDPDAMDAWKKTDYQLEISYGQNFKVSSNGMYDNATIEISMIQTNGDGCYTAAYTPEGAWLEESGAWFLSDDKEEYLSKHITQAREIFGIA